MRELNDTEQEILKIKENRKHTKINIKEIDYRTLNPRQILCIVKNDIYTGYGTALRMMSDKPDQMIGHNLSYVRAIDNIIEQKLRDF